MVVGFLLLEPKQRQTPPASTTTSEAKTATETTAAQPNTRTIAIEGGEPVGGAAELTYKQGSTVSLTVTTDGAEAEVHVHGYDIEKTAAPGDPAKFVFVAKHTGRFEIELHPGTAIARLDVVP